jgi:hypothetical protein
MIKQILFAGLLALSAVACGGDECDDAVDKLEECGWKGEGGVNEDAECSGAGECFAKCVNDAECSEINSLDINSNFYKCTAACND